MIFLFFSNLLPLSLAKFPNQNTDESSSVILHKRGSLENFRNDGIVNFHWKGTKYYIIPRRAKSWKLASFLGDEENVEQKMKRKRKRRKPTILERTPTSSTRHDHLVKMCFHRSTYKKKPSYRDRVVPSTLLLGLRLTLSSSSSSFFF